LTAEISRYITALTLKIIRKIFTKTLKLFSQNVGDTILIKVESSNELQTIHVIAIGPYGLVYTLQFEEAQGKDIYNLTMTLTEEMKPESHVIIFYIRPDGAIIHDEFTLSLGYSIHNSVSKVTNCVSKLLIMPLNN
jgi:hypothetical protein